MNRLSMSSMGLATQCLYGFRNDVRASERTAGRAAAIGRIVHSLVESRVNRTPMASDVDDLHLLAEAKAIFEGPLQGYCDSRDWTACEKGYRYDASTDTCVEGPRRGEPGYDDVPSYVLHGTVDLVHLDPEGALVIDVKTGKPPSDREQLYAQAVAVSRVFNVSSVRIGYARALKTKLEILDDELLDADRLDAEAGRIARTLRVLPTAEPNPGEHCWRCSAWSSCPAKYDEHYTPASIHNESALYADNVRLFQESQ